MSCARAAASPSILRTEPACTPWCCRWRGFRARVRVVCLFPPIGRTRRARRRPTNATRTPRSGSWCVPRTSAAKKVSPAKNEKSCAWWRPAPAGSSSSRPPRRTTCTACSWRRTSVSAKKLPPTAPATATNTAALCSPRPAPWAKSRTRYAPRARSEPRPCRRPSAGRRFSCRRCSPGARFPAPRSRSSRTTRRAGRTTAC
mmetsp:Transcript_10376/g.43577  ORF Transcript_10376/g.43577 Transcript_10376/m.43577 type:complete len:201 (-) Transcript_10376:577-1179(-)